LINVRVATDTIAAMRPRCEQLVHLDAK